MAELNQSGSLSPYTEVVPASARLGDVSKASILTSRRTMRISPQGGQNYGTAGAGGANAQVNFLVSDAAGLIDPRSIRLNYFIQVAGTNTSVADDASVFTTTQISLNGSMLDNLQNSARVANIEARLGMSKSYYETAGSFQGFSLLSPDQTTTAASQWGNVFANTTDLSTMYKKAAGVQSGNFAGLQVSIPLGCLSGFGRMKTYVPISILGDLQINLIAGSNTDVLYQNGAVTADATFSLSGVSLEYDIITASPAYMSLLKEIAMNDARGLVMPFESTICSQAGAIAASASAITENTLIVSRATQNLLRASVVLIPTAGVSSYAAPSQSLFSHAATASVQFRAGSSVYPQLPAFGDASMFNMSLSAYGSPTQETGSVINRSLWCNSTNVGTQGTAAVYETAQALSGGSARFAGADSFIPTYGFATYKGGVESPDVDGVNLSSASGAQLICSVVGAPQTAYSPFVSLVALKFIKAQGGAVSVLGA